MDIEDLWKFTLIFSSAFFIAYLILNFKEFRTLNIRLFMFWFLFWLCSLSGILIAITFGKQHFDNANIATTSDKTSSSRSSDSIRSCLSGGERAYEACVSNNPGGKGRLTCESNWKTKLRSCCNAYPAQATDELQCLSLN